MGYFRSEHRGHLEMTAGGKESILGPSSKSVCTKGVVTQ